MDYQSERDAALSELKKITGISFQIEEVSGTEEEQTLKQLHSLCSAYREKYNKTDFLKSLMLGGISPYDVCERAARLHITDHKSRVLYLLESKEWGDSPVEILKQLFPSQSSTQLVPMGPDSLALLLPLKKNEDGRNCHSIAQTIVDTLNSEALISVQVSYSAVFESLAELPGIFQETSLAMKVGKLFYCGQTVFPHDGLGVGRLIYQLPRTVCERFLKEVFGSSVPDVLDKETSDTVNRFMENSLNIAETSRQLHMHRNTLIYRLEQIQKRTGLDLRRFEDAMTFKIAMMVMNYLPVIEE